MEQKGEMVMKKVLLGLLLGGLMMGCGKKNAGDETKQAAGTQSAKTKTAAQGTAVRSAARAQDRTASVRAKLAKFVPTSLNFDTKGLSATDKKVIKKLVQAAEVMDDLFLIQVDPKNPKLREKLAADPKLKDVLAYFDMMSGPWDRLDHDKPFYGRRKKPLGAGFYPTDMTKKEFETFVKAHPDKAKAFKSYFTVIQRKGKELVAIPYSTAYRPFLQRAAKYLREAAALTKDARLKKYLELRAKAFSTNDYRPSDMAWLDFGDGTIEVVIGPYEVYEDGLFGYKASFESFVCLRDPVYSARLQKIAKYKKDMENALPIADKDKNFKRGGSLPITVVDELFTAGDTKVGVQTLAFNLPNDEVVRQKKGYKLVLLKNVGHAKFNAILMPIARRLMDPEQLKLVNFDAFFTNTLMHETAHGQGPGQIVVERNGKKVKTDVNHQLLDLYSTIEEGKADITGLYLSSYLIGKGVLPKDLDRRVYASYLAGFFRAIRFGATEAHGRANLISFNYLTDKGAILYDKATHRFQLDFSKIKQAVRDLAHDLLTLEARGDYKAAKRFVTKYGVMSPVLADALKRLKGIPVDILPHYTVLEKMTSW